MAVMCIRFRSAGIMSGNFDTNTLRVLQSVIFSGKQNLTSIDHFQV